MSDYDHIGMAEGTTSSAFSDVAAVASCPMPSTLALQEVKASGNYWLEKHCLSQSYLLAVRYSQIDAEAKMGHGDNVGKHLH